MLIVVSPAAPFVTSVPKNTRRAIRHLRPIIEERRKYLNEYGKDWTEKPVRLPYFDRLCVHLFIERLFVMADG